MGELQSLAPLGSHAYFFDVDGTLLEIKPVPSDVIAGPELQNRLLGLRTALAGALALVSGRMISDLDRIFAPQIFPSAGIHGGELRLADGSRLAAENEAVSVAREAFETYVSQYPGLLLEDKGSALTIHFRHNPELGDQVTEFVTSIAQENGLAVQPGKMVAEIKPKHFNKGTAIAQLLETAPFLGRVPVFFGDDLTDEMGFEAVNKLGGLSVHIGEGHLETSAKYHLKSPAELREHLRLLAG